MIVIGVIEIILIGLALSADAVSVSICNILANPKLPKAKLLAMPVLFGLFQGGMPLIGFFAGNVAADLIQQFAGIIALVILGVIGGKMLWDAFHEDEEADEDAVRDKLSYRIILLQAVATSIDALAVGVSLCAASVNIFFAASLIAACTFLCCLVVLLVGKRLGANLGKGAQIAGGLILIAIGLKSMFF